MADFFHNGWSIFIAVITLAGIFACGLLLWSQSKVKVKLGPDGKPLPVETTGHVWDVDLVENNNPLPRWWSIMFYLTIVFGIAYLILFPGLGAMQGTLGWSQVGKYEQEMKDGEEKYGPIFAKYQAMPIPAVAQDPQARAIGERLYLNSCAQCHGSDAQGSKGFPNLTDNDWLYGGTPETVLASIREGRHGQMPSMAAAVGGDADVRNVAHYVLSLSGSSHDPIKAVMGKAKFGACAACHGADGNKTLDGTYPKLAGQYPEYLAKAMREYKSGKRKNAVMAAQAQGLSDKDIANLADYFGSLKPQIHDLSSHTR